MKYGKLLGTAKNGGYHMNNTRIIGNNIRLELEKKSIKLSEFANKTGFSMADIHKLMEGRLFIPPLQLNEIANALHITKEQLIENRGREEYNLLVDNFREFKNEKNQELVLDLIDMYADLSEAL